MLSLRLLPVLPLAHGLLPVGLLAAGHGLALPLGLIAGTITGAFGLHRVDGGIVQNLDSAPPQRLLKFLFTKSTPGLIEIRDVELVVNSQFVPYLLLPGTIAGIFKPQ